MTDTITILVVEDEAIVALDLQSRLRRLGYLVPETAASGTEAIQLAEQLQPDLIFMDIGLQGTMDGIEAAEQICACSTVQVVFLTAYADANTRQRAEFIAPASFLSKPFADEEVLTAIKTALSKRNES